MAFTDDDLKRLKERINSGDIQPDYADKWKALIARLEAAEDAVAAWEDFSNTIHSRVRDTLREYISRMTKADAMKAWRKAAGK